MTQTKKKYPITWFYPKVIWYAWVAYLLGTLPNNYDQVGESIVKYAKKVEKIKASLKMKEF